MSIKQTDAEIFELLRAEEQRQQEGLTLIPSENHTSREVLEALSSVFSDKYAEGYPGRRYYAGNDIADRLESLVQERAKALFGVPYANVQPYSGSPANFAVLLALLEPGDPFMGLDLLHGGHLTHGWKANATSRLWKSIPYHVDANGRIDLAEVEAMTLAEKPKLIWCGGTALPRAIPFSDFSRIADTVGAYLVADISHISGLIAGGTHESPVSHVHAVTTTTHKTLRGPRGAMILATEKGIKKDPELPQKIDKTIIPGLQGGPHLNTIAALGVALKEASTPAFAEYAARVVENARTLADALVESGFTLVSGGTDNHLLLLDLTPGGSGRGVLFHEALERIGIYTNKNTVPNDPSSPFYPSGLRIGTPAVTTRGMSATDMKHIASFIAQVGEHLKNVSIPPDAAERKSALAAFRETLATDPFYDTLRADVRSLCLRYPIPGAA
ncbi:serine hydroxymethyltransferase [candidate division WWE3 bacterium]|uniref:Serine hydroxymethyltransferase n=1 Tax=candidate division WWE3 bacterium TaxID=2053526 RepID=A0A928TPJ3_UNCKA|nr:serine hydroxymethyltransferase [candidate division WWE3 bacterium]